MLAAGCQESMMGRAWRIMVLAVLLVLLALAVALGTTGIARNAAGMAARSVCSAVFVAGRPADQVFDQDVRPASPALALVRVSVDAARHQVRGTFAGLFERTARFAGLRGCVLDLADTAPTRDATSRDDAPAQPWPAGNRPLEAAQWGEGVDAARLASVVDQAFVGAGDPAAANARAVAVVHRGRLLVNRQAPGLAPETALHGWSMTKTVTMMLVHKRAAERGLDTSRRVVDLFAPGRPQPAWADAWRADGRAAITLDDLLAMRDGLAQVESYAAWGAVPRMLFGAADVSGHAAAAAAEAPPGTRWRYLSASTNIAARVLRAQFDSDAAYWAYPRQALFDPIGARSAVLETDADGTWIGSSYLWASSGDWARLGTLLMDDGRWQGQAALPPGVLARAMRPAMAAGEGLGYGMQTWRIGQPEQGDCKGQVPPDTIAMRGHWGQIVAMVPSRQAVIVRLGWTFDKTRFDNCRFVADVLASLR
jgi:CubicO group peptidase (beta-lactamase class C family)